MRELVFLDTECTGLDQDADIWEFGAIRRHADGAESRLHIFIAHDETKAARLPKSSVPTTSAAARTPTSSCPSAKPR